MTYFFIGVAGAGMSALAQFLAMQGHSVSGSDRLFVKEPSHPVRKLLANAGITTYEQGKANIPGDATVVISTAIEPTVPEYAWALEKHLTILHRTDLLRQITLQYDTIAVSGTSGKSTTVAMIFHILQQAGLEPSVINGAPLISLQSKNIIGNAWVGKSRWLVIEADESDGTLVKYEPHTGLILNIDLDHSTMDELMRIFSRFATNCKHLSVNLSDKYARTLSRNPEYDFCWEQDCGFSGKNCKVSWQGTAFEINGLAANIPQIGCHNAQNATAAIAAAKTAGVDIKTAIEALKTFRGIHRRMQVIYRGINFSVIDDYAHNPAKITAAIRTAQQLAPQVIAWFQPHGFSPLKLFGERLVESVSQILRDNDIFVMSKVYYAGGTAPKEVCARDYVQLMRKAGANAFFLENRRNLPDFIKNHAKPPTVVLLMGARDPMLDFFANYVSNYVIYFDDQI